MAGMYTISLLRTGPQAEWSRLMPFPSDADAIAAARRIAASEGSRSPEPVSLMVGRSVDEGAIDWLGGWDWDAGGALYWDEMAPPEDPGRAS
jgi:hypothetical protein